MIWIIGGTGESHEFAEEIKKSGKGYIVTIATCGGQEFFSDYNVVVGRMNYEDMLKFIDINKITSIVDMSHPFASIVTDNAKNIAKNKNIPYFRYIRGINLRQDNYLMVESYNECFQLLKTLKGNFFFTTGSKFIEKFQEVRGTNKYVYRVLPTSESLEIVEKSQVEMRDLVAMLGPFSTAMNEALFKNFKIDYCVMKESGENSGFEEKIRACSNQGVMPIVIKRKAEDGYKTFEEIIGKLEEIKSGELL